MSHPVSDLSKRAAHRERGIVLVIVPKDDEFRETLLAFDLTPADVQTLGEKDQIEYVETDAAGDRIVIACLDAQGNSESQTFASSMIDRFAPSFLCVTGTALGNPAYSSVGAVFASRQIYGLTQIRQTVRGSVYQDVTPTDVDKAVLWDLRDHIKTPASIAAVRESISQRATELSLAIDADRYTVDSEIIASGNEYFKSTTEHVERQLWERYPSVRAYDMESWGVVKAAERSNVDWLSFRGVSDFGVDGGMSEQQRQLAAYASAAVLRSFLDSPRTRMRQKSHARRVDRDELPRSNFYVENSTSVASFQERIEIGRRLAADPAVTAVFCGNDQIAMGVIRGVTSAGLRVPEDISVAGFDDHPLASLWSPALTTVKQDFAELGRRGVQLLLAEISGEANARRFSSDRPRLIIRESTAPPPAKPGG